MDDTRPEIEANVASRNQISIPHQEFIVPALPTIHAGALTGIYGKTSDEAIEYVRNERKDWKQDE